MRRHGIPFPGHVVPFGALVDYIPQPDATKHMDPLDAKAIGGIFVGYHILPGGIFAGDYLVATLEDLSGNINAGGRQVKVHRVKEVFPLLGKPEYPIAIYRKMWQDRERDHGMPKGPLPDDELSDPPPALVPSSDEGETASEQDLGGASAPTVHAVLEAASSSHQPAVRAPTAIGPAPAGRDTRGEGNEQPGGRKYEPTKAPRDHPTFLRSCGQGTQRRKNSRLSKNTLLKSVAQEVLTL